MRTLLSLFSILVLFAACDNSKDKPAAKADPGKVLAVKDGPRAEQVHAVTCGHTLESVGHCGDYIEVDGQYIPLLGVELDREKWPKKDYPDGMLFCRKGKMKARTQGEVKDGKFVASSFVLFEPEKK